MEKMFYAIKIKYYEGKTRDDTIKDWKVFSIQYVERHSNPIT